MAVVTETVVGSHVLTIDSYTKTTAALAVGQKIISDRFHVGGYDWYIECFPSGDHKETADWVSVFLSLDLDHYGDSHEVKPKYDFVLLDRDGEAILWNGTMHEEIYRTVFGTPATWGTSEFVQRKTLESYLIVQEDDCCRIRCDVAVSKRPPAVPVPPPERRLGDLLLASEVGRDVTFVVAGELFTAHSCVVAARSSAMFMEELLGKAKESAVGGVRVVDGMQPRVFKALLHFVYTDTVPDDDEEADNDGDRIAVVQGLLAAADRYDMARLKLICGNLLLTTEVGRDVTFVVDGELFTAHRCVLAARSSTVFMAKVLGKAKESAGGGSSHVRVDGVTPRVFKALLHFIYTDSLSDEVRNRCIRIAITEGLLEAADWYGMERLKMICADVLCSNIDVTTAVNTMRLAHRHRCLKLNQACVEYLKGKIETFNLEEAQNRNLQSRRGKLN